MSRVLCNCRSLLLLGFVITGAGSCEPPGDQAETGRARIRDAWHEQRMIVAQAPPIIAIGADKDIAAARLEASRADPARFAERLSSKRIQVDALPYLIGTEEGRAFLQATGRRAIARGNPAASCPAMGVASAPASANRAEVVAEALAQCAANLPAGTTDCGCQIVAMDDLVTVPRSELSYATGVTARMSFPTEGKDRLLVAEDLEDHRILLRDLTGKVGEVTLGDGETAILHLEGGELWTGPRRKVGFRRGRIAERLYLSNAEGARMVLLLGFEPDELAAFAGAWLAWPEDL